MVYPISKWIVPPIYKLWIRKIEGLEDVPKKGSFIIALNHTSYFDVLLPSVIIMPKINKKIHALANNYYWKPFITRLILIWGKSIPVYVEKEKGAKQKNRQSIEKAISSLKRDEIIMIFPEGRRSKDGKLQKAYTGIARLALKAKVPVLPFGIIDSNKVLPRGAIFPRFARCEVNIGKLMHFDKYYNKKPSNKIFEEATRSIMKKIAKLINQKYNY